MCEQRPIGECCICDEPFWRGYTCDHCERPICPGCVCSDLIHDDHSWLCAECEGAGIWWQANPMDLAAARDAATKPAPFSKNRPLKFYQP